MSSAEQLQARPSDGVRAPVELATAHDWHRSRAFTVGSLGLTVCCAALMYVPAVAAALRVTVRAGVTAALACTIASIGAYAAFRARGISRLYFVADFVESSVVAASCGYLIYLSAAPDSLFWCFYVFHASALASGGRVRRHLVLLAAMPLAVGVATAVRGDTMAALVSALMGGFGLVLHTGLAEAFTAFEAARQREADLKMKLAAISVAAERARIAEDLHDSVGADLAALVWRIRSLTAPQRATGAVTVSPVELGAIESRVAGAIHRLRDAVVDLRHHPKDWDEVSSILRERCRELSGDAELALDLQRAPGSTASGDINAELVRIASELVRNAGRHSRARRIDVLVALEPLGARVVVADDGEGIGAERAGGGGGLDHLRRRVEELAGRLAIRSDGRGTRVEVTLPLGQPPRPVASSPAAG